MGVASANQAADAKALRGGCLEALRRNVVVEGVKPLMGNAARSCVLGECKAALTGVVVCRYPRAASGAVL